jgi:hypothetical protein
LLSRQLSGRSLNLTTRHPSSAKVKKSGAIYFPSAGLWDLPVVLYACETWSLTLREESRPRVFENRMLRRIFVTKRDEVTMKWRKLHKEELNYLYCSSIIIRVIKSRRMR